ncbi:hypothetical protein F2P81_020820 [Scophthalmus maximus]|uniref:Uncharacterized protein n=1 Tax=Scophthalmus maximus TaxID=52904 RepID=A0A6A4RVM5_SCOMX|nr:hypothetical protein F2P81_020820 [Scophthalmus maximus]
MFPNGESVKKSKTRFQRNAAVIITGFQSQLCFTRNNKNLVLLNDGFWRRLAAVQAAVEQFVQQRSGAARVSPPAGIFNLSTFPQFVMAVGNGLPWCIPQFNSKLHMQVTNVDTGNVEKVKSGDLSLRSHHINI